jgi:hypothetical protein
VQLAGNLASVEASVAKCTSAELETLKCGDFRYMSSGKFPEYDEVRQFLSNLNFEKN